MASKIWTLVLTLFLTTPVLSNNLLRNHGFEDWIPGSQGQDSIPEYWNFSFLPGISGTLTRTDGYDGYGIRIDLLGNRLGYDLEFYQVISGGVVDSIYALSIKAKKNSGNPGIQFYSVWLDECEQEVGFPVASGIFGLGDDWEQFEMQAEKPQLPDDYPYEIVGLRFGIRIHKSISEVESVVLDNAFFGPIILNLRESKTRSKRLSYISAKGNVLQLEYGSGLSGMVKVEVYSIHGIKVREETLSLIGGSEKISFDIRELPPGVYVIVMVQDNFSEFFKLLKL